MAIITQIANYLINTIGALSYPGIFLLMVIESTVFPLPSEFVLIPAGVLVQRGEMNAVLIVLFSAIGGVVGALLMYYLSLYLGRALVDKMIVKYGKFLFLEESSLLKAELFFKKHGEITIFVSRLLPVVRHLISIPAGLSKMSVLRFSIYTFIGSAFWSAVLVGLGYFLGEAIAVQNFSLVTVALIVACAVIVGLYILVKVKKY